MECCLRKRDGENGREEEGAVVGRGTLVWVEREDLRLMENGVEGRGGVGVLLWLVCASAFKGYIGQVCYQDHFTGLIFDFKTPQKQHHRRVQTLSIKQTREFHPQLSQKPTKYPLVQSVTKLTWLNMQLPKSTLGLGLV